jgi:ABC-type phosphate/phosphonate transport system substrate-binding protein
MTMIRLACALLSLVPAFACAADTPEVKPLTLIVMDPLSAQIACDCVQGYAQRKYEVLGNFLSQRLQRPVKVFWSDSLARALEEKSGGEADLIIGKHSVVLHDAQASGLAIRPLASLTGLDGQTTMTGLIVVRAKDAAQSVADLAGYRIFFGPSYCDEKFAAPQALLDKHAVPPPATAESYPTCGNASLKLIELGPDVKAAAVISSYAVPLLEGCGTIKKGDLRVLAATEPVPFITAFVNTALTAADQTAIQKILMDVGTDADLLIALETAEGFVEYRPPATTTPATDKSVSQAADSDSAAAKKKN